MAVGSENNTHCLFTSLFCAVCDGEHNPDCLPASPIHAVCDKRVHHRWKLPQVPMFLYYPQNQCAYSEMMKPVCTSKLLVQTEKNWVKKNYTETSKTVNCLVISRNSLCKLFFMWGFHWLSIVWSQTSLALQHVQNHLDTKRKINRHLNST